MPEDTLLRTVFLFIIITPWSRAESLSVKVPASHITAARGHAVVLGCEFSPDFGQDHDLSSLVVTWQRQDDSRVIHSFYYEQDQLDKQDPAYRNRTTLFVKELNKGNASVKVEHVEMQDAGRYLCIVSTNQGTDRAELQLEYGAFYTEPRLTISMHSSVIEVQYETEGFPAPEVMWKREDGKNLSDHIMTSIKLNNVTGLYHVTSNYMAPAPSLNFSFILENQLLHQYLRSIVSYKGTQTTCFNEVFALGVVSVLLAVFAVMMLAWVWYKKKKGAKQQSYGKSVKINGTWDTSNSDKQNPL